MLAIWRDLLGEPELGTGDEFFVFGGDSLTALRLLTRVRERWGRALSTADLFEHPTVAGFTAVLAAAEPLPPRLPAAAPDPRTLSFAQERLWFFEQLLPGSPLNTIPMGFRTDGELDRQALEERCASSWPPIGNCAAASCPSTAGRRAITETTRP